MAIYDWSWVSTVDEEFFSRFFLIFNIGVSLIMQLSLWMLGNDKGNLFALLKGSYANTLFHSLSRFFWPIFVGIIFSVLIICGILIVYQKIKSNNSVNPIILNNNLNNIVYNNPLITTCHTFSLLFTVVCCVIIITISRYLKIQIPTYSVTVNLLCHIFFPFILVSRKREFIKYLLKEIKEFFI